MPRGSYLGAAKDILFGIALGLVLPLILYVCITCISFIIACILASVWPPGYGLPPVCVDVLETVGTITVLFPLAKRNIFRAAGYLLAAPYVAFRLILLIRSLPNIS